MPVVARRFQAVLFDLGSTLLVFEGALPQVLAKSDAALGKVLTGAGLQLDEQAFLQAYRARLDAYYRQRDTEFIEQTTQWVLNSLLIEWGVPHPSKALLREALEAGYAVTQAHWRPDPQALATLEELNARGYRLGLLSNAGDDADVHRLIDLSGFRPCFESVLTSAVAGIRKPNPLIFHRLLQKMRVPSQQAVMVGDTLGADVLGAHHAGMAAIWITRPPEKPANLAHLETIQPEATITHLAELPELLDHWEEKQQTGV